MQQQLKQDQQSGNPSEITINPPNSLPVPLAANQSSKMTLLEVPKSMGDLMTNYALGSEADEVAVSRAMAPCDLHLKDFIGKTIAIVGVVMNMAEFASQQVQGEMIEKIYASIVLENGAIVGTTGKAVMGQLAYLIKSRPAGAFNPPAIFEVREHPCAPPKQPYYSLRRVASKAKTEGKK